MGRTSERCLLSGEGTICGPEAVSFSERTGFGELLIPFTAFAGRPGHLDVSLSGKSPAHRYDYESCG